MGTAEFQAFFDETLRPLVQANGGDVTLDTCTEAHVAFSLIGKAAFATDSWLLKEDVLEPAAKKFLGADVQVEYKNTPTIPPGAKRPSTPAR